MGKETDAIIKVIHDAGVKAAQETAGEAEPKLTGSLEWPVKAEIKPGLDGAISNETKIGYVNGTKGWLIYQGYNIFDLAEYSTFEETSYILLYGKMPNKKELETFNKKLIANRKVPKAVIDVLKTIPIKDTHPMISLYIGVAVLATGDKTTETTTVENETEISIKLIAQMATIAGAIGMLRAGKEPVEPDPSLNHAANFLYMLTGAKPDEINEKIMDLALILHADHGMNASTFTTMVTNSSLSDMYSSVVAGICSLKGPLHGGANEKVLYDLEEIKTADNVEPWFKKVRETKRKVMGFGHRVYKAYDPRARILGPLVNNMLEKHPEIKPLYETAKKLDAMVCSELGKEKKVFPNVDFYSGLVYKAMGIETAMFTPIFAVSRISGWAARALEYLATNRIFRPRAVYTGEIGTEYKPIDKR